MLEIIMIALSFAAAQRWKSAGVEGVSLYIVGAWGAMLGGVILGTVISANAESMAGLAICGLLGYGAAIALLVSAFRTGKKLVEKATQERAKAEEKKAEAEQQKQREMAKKMAEMQHQLEEMKSGTENHQ
jgi:hypothetical protein